MSPYAHCELMEHDEPHLGNWTEFLHADPRDINGFTR